MKRVPLWGPIFAVLAWAGCYPATVVPVGPAYEAAPPPPGPPPPVVMEAQVYVANQPPPPPAEYPPPAPGPGYTWVAG